MADAATNRQSSHTDTRHQGLAVPNPLVSVIMNCLDCDRYLKEAIDSVYAQTYPNWEIIFWDNCSTDGSGEIARRYDKRLRYFRGEQTVPLGAARNQAIEQAGGEFIAFLDCDDLWMPEKLEKQVPLFEDPEVGLVFSDIIHFNNDGEEEQRYKKHPYWTGDCFRKLLGNYFLCMPTLVIRKEAFSSLEEWFDPQFDMIEEADLAIRIGYSWKLAMVDEPLARWRMHIASSTFRKFHLFSQETMAMLDKYRALFPDFEASYRDEIDAITRRIITDDAIYHLLNGELHDARKSIRKLERRTIKTTVLYAMTFLGKKPVSLILAIAKKLKGVMLPTPS